MKICKRFGALLLALVLTFSLSVTAFAAVEDTGFSDVDADDWFAASAVYVRDNGIMNGTSATTFDPNGTTSRGQITAILAKDNANVQRMVNESAGENAYTMFDTDEHLEQSTIEALKQIPAVYRVRVIK